MKHVFTLILLLVLSACQCVQSTDRLLAEVWERDQSVRHQMLALTKAVTAEGQMNLVDSLIATHELLERIDAENGAIVDSLLQDGMPANLAPESYKTIWIVIDHAPLEMQEKYLPMVEQMAVQQLIAASDYACLFDRVAMYQNRPQRYGSQSVQFGQSDAMRLYLWPVEDLEKLDALRVEMGMQPIADYLRQLTEATGLEAIFDPAMTVDALNELRGTE